MNRDRLYTIVIISYLFVFALVFNRRLIYQAFGKETIIEVKKTIHHIRAENTWNLAHADSCTSLIQDGDIIFRAGTDRISELFKGFNVYDPSFSHAGIIMIENGYPMVYNMDASSNQPNHPIKRDSIQNFINPFDNTAFAVYRTPLNDVQQKELKKILVEYYIDRLPFDPQFNLLSDSSFYGNELVYKSFLAVTQDSTWFSTTQAGGYTFITTDNLFHNLDNKLVCKIVYKQ